MAIEALVKERDRSARSRGHLARAWSRLIRKKIAVASVAALVILYSAGIFASWVPTGYSYRELDYSALGAKAPSTSHWAGTDFAGRDILTRVMWGIRNTVLLTVISMATGGLLIGVSLGLMAGYFRGKVDSLIMRVGELFTAFPEILLVIILAATLKPRIQSLVVFLEDHTFINLVKSGGADYIVVSLALVSFGWIGMARLVRGQILSLRETPAVEAAIALGASTPRILFRHLLPNAISPIVVTVSMGMGTMIGTEIILSWLGLGIQPPRPSLGTMLLEGGSLAALREKPWLLLAPGLVAWSLVLAWNLLGDQLNDVLNPRTR